MRRSSWPWGFHLQCVYLCWWVVARLHRLALPVLLVGCAMALNQAGWREPGSSSLTRGQALDEFDSRSPQARHRLLGVQERTRVSRQL